MFRNLVDYKNLRKIYGLSSFQFRRFASSYLPLLSAESPLLFRQLFEKESSTYTYLLADKKTNEAILIDPVLETVERDTRLINELKLTLTKMLNTHMHADHITGTGTLKTIFKDAKSYISSYSGAEADVHFDHGEKIKFGNYELECRSTPGHTDGCMTFVFHQAGCAFTGDALLYRGCGRTDFQAGNSEALFESIYREIFSLPDSYIVFPAHDYRGHLYSTVGEEKRLNPRLTKSKEEFKKIMKELNLPYPKKFDVSLPANKMCGVF